ncbi:MAG: bacterioferritin [Zymomonas mobilis]|uniref:Bacterioferritin n=1 Tax=Zymomonas mobilis TaxID=542 RepID=A0A542W2E1_ZYMMB|nr:bacterioferritin [Zymomonas mobilis]TQL17741.1 bacterioferritin [Zymomonas mobilis]
MKGNKEVIDHLNALLKSELTSINQYFLHYRIVEDWGIDKLAELERSNSIDEMKHADKLAKRLLFLEGFPNFQDMGHLRIGENVEEVIKADLALEAEDAIPLYKKAIECCEKHSDFGTRDLLLSILTEEEGHADGLDTQLKLIKRMGIQGYIQLNSQTAEASEE